MTKKKKLTKKQETFIEIYQKKNGHISKACAAAKIHRSTYYEWMKDDLFKDEIEAIDEAELDRAEELARILREGIPEYETDDEGKLVKDAEGEAIIIGWIEKPDSKMIKHYLETKGKKRGYGKQIGVDLNLKEMPKNVSIGLTVHKKK